MANNQDSIYYFKPGEFKEYIRTIANKSITVAEALDTFRELRRLPNEFKQMSIGELSDNPSLIEKLFKALRDAMQPESKRGLSRKEKEEREHKILRSIADNFEIDNKHTYSKVLTGYHNDGVRAFPFELEVAIAARKDLDYRHAGEIKFIGNINSTPSIDGGEGYFQDGNFYCVDKKGKQIFASSVMGILHNSGFNVGDYISKKRAPSVFYINLKTPCPDWLGAAGKTRPNLAPYADLIAKTTSDLAHKIPSYHGKGYRMVFEKSSADKSAIEYLRDFLKQRWDDVQQDPSLKIRDRLTQSGVWYRIRPIMIEDGFEPQQNWGKTRKSLTGEINDVCQELFGFDREELGIIAAARAVMLYDGQSYPVDIDSIKALAEKGIVIIIIEKEGIADVLVNFAEEYGIALVHTQGKFVEYVKGLIEAGKKSGSVVVTLTDYDADGMDMAKRTRTETPRIGVTRETITWLQENGYPVTEADVQEEYSPTTHTDDEYLKDYRIELDSIVAKVGAEAFWKYITYQLQQPQFSPEGFDYNRVDVMPANEVLYHKNISNFLSYLNNFYDELLEDEREKIEESQKHVKNLVTLEDKIAENQKRQEPIIAKDKNVRLIVSKITKLLKLLPDSEDFISN